jgi:hypothetical protein
MAVHKLSMIEREPSRPDVPDPAECREHFAAGRLPVYYGRQLVAYVDDPDDLPAACFVERDGRSVGILDVWQHPAEQIAA